MDLTHNGNNSSFMCSASFLLNVDLCMRWTFPSSFLEEVYAKAYSCRSCCITIVPCFQELLGEDKRLTSLRKVFGPAVKSQSQLSSGTSFLSLLQHAHTKEESIIYTAKCSHILDGKFNQSHYIICKCHFWQQLWRCFVVLYLYV